MNYKDYEKVINNLKDFKVDFNFVALEIAIEIYYKAYENVLLDKEKDLIFRSAYEVYLKTENLTISEIVNALVEAKDNLSKDMSKQDLVNLVLKYTI